MHDRAVVPLTLLMAAGECRTMAHFSRVLHTLADLCDAQACILWEEIITFGTPERRFFALAEYFPAGLTWYYLPENSAPAEALKAKLPNVVHDVEAKAAAGNFAMQRLLDKGIRSFCCMPVNLGARRDAAVTLYRTIDRRFTEQELKEIEDASGAIPYLFRTVRTEMGLRLLRDVEELFRAQGVRALQDVSIKVTEAFGAMESAIYLEDRYSQPGVYRHVASVWPWDWERKPHYSKTDEGLTAWTISHGRPLRFLDLSHFETERHAWKYEEITFAHKERLEGGVRSSLKRSTIPPLSFMSAPVKDRDRTIGAIRCCVTPASPHLFDDDYVEILQVVADQIGERWSTHTTLRNETVEKKLLDQFAKGVDRLNAISFQELMKHEGPSLQRQFQNALQFLAQANLGDALSIRMVDSQRKDLHFIAWRGKPWDEGGERRRDERLKRRYPISADSTGGLAFREKRVLVDQQLGQPGHPSSMMFPDATRVLHAPILVGDEPIGVLDIHGFGEAPFPTLLDTIAGFFARHLGLYHEMFLHFRALSAARETLQQNYDAQVQIYEDFHHQVSSPIQKAHYLAQQAVWATRPAPDVLRAIRSHTHRAEQVAQNIKYFIALAKDEFEQPEGVQPERVVLTSDRLVRHLKELAEDQEAVSDRTRQVTFKVDAASFQTLDTVTVQANLELLEHAMMNLLDNASKYSNRQTTVTILGGIDQTRNLFRIAVLNKGYSIDRDERKQLCARGYRGQRASLTVTEGEGIGLYIVQKLMKSMRGDVEIIPTDSRGLNEFRLVMPFAAAKGR